MKKTAYRFLIAAALAVTGLFTPEIATAQLGGPSGNINVTVTNSPVWDMQGYFTSVDFTVLHTNTEGTVSETDVSFPVSVTQSGSGQVKGSDSGVEISVFAPTDSVQTNYSFVGKVRVNGKFNSNNGHGHLTLDSTAVGSTSIAGHSRHFSATDSINGTFEDSTETLSGTKRVSISAAGHGTRSNKIVITNKPFGSSSQFPGDGSWTLSMTLATVHHKVLGTAVVTLNSGQDFVYRVRGTFRPANGTSTLALTGLLTSKGSTLMVKLSGNTIDSIKGHISGQSVNF